MIDTACTGISMMCASEQRLGRRAGPGKTGLVLQHLCELTSGFDGIGWEQGIEVAFDS